MRCEEISHLQRFGTELMFLTWACTASLVSVLRLLCDLIQEWRCVAQCVHMLPVITCLLHLFCDLTQECRRVPQCVRLLAVVTTCL